MRPSETPDADAAALACPGVTTVALAAVSGIVVEPVDSGSKRGILSPELRARLDAMTPDYVKILTRIDQMAIDADPLYGAGRRRYRDVN